jgi:hypothetical protein
MATDDTQARLDAIRARLADATMADDLAVEYFEDVPWLAAELERVTAALPSLAAQAQDILDTLASGSDPWAATGYGYEHMGDYTRDVRPLCEQIVALAGGARAAQEDK